jgi:hypothetical protein
MASAAQDQAARHVDAHGQLIDELHRTLAAIPGANKEGLQKAFDKLKAAQKQFRDDALGCMN